jgi:hypothetical protein
MLSYCLDYEVVKMRIIFVKVLQKNFHNHQKVTADEKRANYPNNRLSRYVSGEYRRRIIERS